MSGLIMAAQLILGLSILVVLHELGHYLAARAFGIRVEKFYLFFDAWGFKFFNFKVGHTEYGMGWLPPGGYVKIAGMIDESMDKEAMKKPPQPYEFRSKPAWQRLIVMVGGVLMNVILGIIIYTCILLFYTKQYLPVESVKDGIYAYPAARMIGFQSGDKILEIDGKKVVRFEDILSTKVLFGSTVTVERNSLKTGIVVPDTLYKMIAQKKKELFISFENHSFVVDSVLKVFEDYRERLAKKQEIVTPAFKSGLLKGDEIKYVGQTPVESFGHFRELMQENIGKTVLFKVSRNNATLELMVSIDSLGKIGIASNKPDYKLADYTVIKAIKYGASDAIETLVANAKGLAMIFKGKEKVSESVQGPIGIAKIYGGTWDWRKFWAITGLLSMILAFMNILPIPALDGGHVIFLTIEAITRKKFSDKFMERVQIVGMVIILSLMVLVIGNDIFRLFK
ncbi:MAG: RIP metalloprotease RseP [Bacteroidetes bacterium RIFOXYB2_FULL_35_7]|nr:MAG: RIP metalloprotease RseP [Bacteroidetes bacterium RIFOXYB2_FULL_35_7]